MTRDPLTRPQRKVIEKMKAGCEIYLKHLWKHRTKGAKVETQVVNNLIKKRMIEKLRDGHHILTEKGYVV